MPCLNIFGRWRSTARDTRPSRVARASEVPPVEASVEGREPEETEQPHVYPEMIPEIRHDRPEAYPEMQTGMSSVLGI